MSAAFQTGSSFIPKSTLERPSEPSYSSVGLLMVISLMILLISGIVLGGAMLYKTLVFNEINAPCDSSDNGTQSCGLKASVDREQHNIDQLTILALQRLDKKLGTVSKLIDQHKDLLRVFQLLEKNTLPSIAYTSLSYAPKQMTLDGQASSFEDIAVQSNVFTEAKRNNQIKEFMFSDLDQGANGGVRFKLTLVINPDLVLASTPISQ